MLASFFKIPLLFHQGFTLSLLSFCVFCVLTSLTKHYVPDLSFKKNKLRLYQRMAFFHEVAHNVQSLSKQICTQRRWEESMAACPVLLIFQDSLLGRCNRSHCFGVGACHIPLLPEVWYTAGLMHHFYFYHILSEPSASERTKEKQNQRW